MNPLFFLLKYSLRAFKTTFTGIDFDAVKPHILMRFHGKVGVFFAAGH